jgi:hypothetical protein
MKSQSLTSQLENETSFANQLNDNTNNINYNSTSCTSSSSSVNMNSPDKMKMTGDKWNLEDEYYQLNIGCTNGEINYKNLFRFNKNFDNLLTKDFDFTKSNEHLDNSSTRSNENKNTSTSTYKSPILLKYSSYYNNSSLSDNENKSKYDYLNESYRINDDDLNIDRSFNMNNDIFKKYQQSKKLSNGNLFT